MINTVEKVKNPLAPIKQLAQDYVYWHSLKSQLSLSQNEWCFICPYGIGDTYFVCALARQFLIHNGGSGFTVGVKKSHIEIANLFRKDLKQISVIDWLNLRSISKFSQYRSGEPLIGHPAYYLGDEYVQENLGANDINLLDLYKALLRLPSNTPLSKPEVDLQSIRSAEKNFEALGLPCGKTVILAPEANSSKTIYLEFWYNLSEKLKANGFTVCTNVIQNASPISGTIPIAFPIKEAIPTVELAGWLISSRSGLCDLVSSANCKLSVIYLEQQWYAGTVFTGSSLKKMGISESVYEYEVSEGDDLNLLISRIIHER